MWALSATATEVTLNAPGVPRGFADTLRGASLSIATAGRDDTTPQDLLAAAKADYARLIGVLYAAGHYSSTLTITVDGREAAAITPLSAPDRIERITLDVTPRQAFTFSRAVVAPQAPGTRLPEGFAPGATARGDLIAAAARAGVDGWRAQGHAKADIAGRMITADHRDATLEARVTLDPGPRLTFGDLLIDPQGQPGRVRPGRIRAIAGLPTGAVFDPEKAKRAADRLRRSGAFRSVALREADAPRPDGALDFQVQVVDAKRRRVGAGAELSSLGGLMLSGFWLHRNLLGGAERLRLDAEVAGIGGESGGMDFSLGARLERPATFTPDTSLFTQARLESVDEPDYKERNAQVGAGLSHIFSKTLSGEAGIAYRLSDIEDDLGARQVQHLLVPASLTLDKRDDPLDAKAGHYLSVETTPFVGLDTSSGLRLFADARVYRSFGAGNGVTLAGRAQLGSLGFAPIIDVPPEMLFYSGGAGTVRGQGYRTLGVSLPGVGEVGGRSFMAFTAEIRADVWRNLQAVAFADTGFIGEDALGGGIGRWHSGAGIGGRYKTSVGPLRVDLATPVDGDDMGSTLELYIGIGQAF